MLQVLRRTGPRFHANLVAALCRKSWFQCEKTKKNDHDYSSGHQISQKSFNDPRPLSFSSATTSTHVPIPSFATRHKTALNSTALNEFHRGMRPLPWVVHWCMHAADPPLSTTQIDSWFSKFNLSAPYPKHWIESEAWHCEISVTLHKKNVILWLPRSLTTWWPIRL
jgi:hypothetical protein